MKFVILLLMSFGAVLAEDIQIDPEKPGLLIPGKSYSFQIRPTDTINPAVIRLRAEKASEHKTAEGQAFAPIDQITVEQNGKIYELSYEYTDVGVPQIDIADFDGDGDSDFRIIMAWGTGGSWYCYYRYNNDRYERWSEPEELGLNGIPDEGRMNANGRSGPESSSTEYQFRDGHFRKVRAESIRLKESLPELKDLKDDFVSVYITEEWDDNRLIRRIVEPQYEQK